MSVYILVPEISLSVSLTKLKIKQIYISICRVYQLNSLDRPHEYIFMDEAGFNLTKRRTGQNLICQQVLVAVPGQHVMLILCYVLPPVLMRFSTIMPPWDRIILNVS